jgi:hypothetical protein
VHENNGAQLNGNFSRVELFCCRSRAMLAHMNEDNENPRRYKWPWFVLAAFIIFVALAILWMSVAVKRERQERDYSAPLPSAPAQ